MSKHSGKKHKAEETRAAEMSSQHNVNTLAFPTAAALSLAIGLTIVSYYSI